MANRNFYRDAGSNEPGVVTIFLRLVFSSGQAGGSWKMVDSVTGSTGEYDITFSDRYRSLIGLSFFFCKDGGLTKGWLVQGDHGDALTGGGSVLSIVTSNSDAFGTPAAPPDSTELYLTIHLSNSSAT